MSEVMGIDVVSVPVSDQDRALGFYRDLLGFELVADGPMGEDRWVQLVPPGSSCTITLVTWMETMPAGSLRGLVLGVRDLDTLVAYLNDAGVEAAPIQDADWGRFSTVSDPDGNGLVLRQAPRG